MMRNSWKWSNKLGLFALLSLLAGCDAAPVGGDASEVKVDPVPPGSYRLYVAVRGLDYMRDGGGTLFTIRTPAGRVVASAGFPRTWNTYCANDHHELHFFTYMPAGTAYSFDTLPKPDATLKTAYAFAKNGALYIDDYGNNRQFRINVAGTEVSEMASVHSPDTRQGCAPFIANGRYYRWAPGQIRACPQRWAEQGCEDIAIEPSNFPYVFAEHNGRVLVGTNWGDILIHSSEGWCRAEYISERYACPPSGTPLAAIPTAPTGMQFYSSIRYQDKTYLGKYPDGQLYEFDGESVVLSADSLPSAGQVEGSEAQSLAIYCGDLFVGRWPRGAIWRRDRETTGWERLERLFSHPADVQPWIPYFGMEPAGTELGFFGQRVTSLALLSDSLFASTSNKNFWNRDIGNPDFMTAEEAAEYGAIHRVRRPGCVSTLAPDSPTFLLQFDFTPETITVRHRQTVLVEAANNGMVPSADDIVSLGEGVFGKLSGATLESSIRLPQ